MRSTTLQAIIPLFLLVFGIQHAFAQLHFSEKEKAWIATHDSIVLAVDNTYPPLNFIDRKGELTGLNIDLVQLIEKRIGIKIILEGSNWDVALGKAMNHEVDGVVNATALEERKSKLYFSEGFFRDPYALIAHKSDEGIKSLEDLRYKKVAVKKNSIHLKLLKAKVPEVEIVEILTLMDGISLLSSLQVDGIYDDLAPLFHLISSSNLSNMKVAFIEENTESARIAVRNNDLVLLSILNKGILSITDSERLQIQSKWFKFAPQKDYTFYYITIGVLFTLMLIIGLWSWSLKLIVNKKTSELNEELVQRKQTEKELRKAKEKAVKSDKLKSAFLANMSHEIRTPLNSIIGFSSLLIDDDLTQDERHKHFNIITSSSNSLLSLINDIIDFSKIEAGYLEINQKEVLVTSLFNDLKSVFNLELSRLMNEKEGPEFSVLPNELIEGVSVYADEIRLNQVFTILINNAIKFTNEGYIKVEAQLATGGMIKFSVEDSGIGIDSAYHEVIFNRFHKIEDNVENLYRGAGLGLSIAKQLTALMCGEMWVESKLNEGAIFYFTIPMVL